MTSTSLKIFSAVADEASSTSSCKRIPAPRNISSHSAEVTEDSTSGRSDFRSHEFRITERFPDSTRQVGTIRWECLDKFIVFGKRHLEYLCQEFTRYYNEKRSHMECGHLPPLAEVPEEVDTLKPSEVRVREYVGGLVKSFERRAG